MAKHIDHEVTKGIKVTIQNAKFVSLTCDEVASMDNASCESMHGYIMHDWCHIPLLLNVQHVVFGSNANSLTFLIMNFLMTQRGLKEEQFTSKPVYFGVHGVNIFQGLKSGITVQIQC
jgi:hypothetical protein